MDSSANPVTDTTWESNGNGNGNGSGTGLMDKARDQIQPLVTQAQEKAGEVMGQARSQVTTQITDQKTRAIEGLENVSQILRQTGQSLREQDNGAVSQYADKAADQIDHFAVYLMEKDVDEIVGQVQEFARSQPALILGATFALGFLAARLLKNAETGSGSQPRYDDYSSGTSNLDSDFGQQSFAGSTF